MAVVSVEQGQWTSDVWDIIVAVNEREPSVSWKKNYENLIY